MASSTGTARANGLVWAAAGDVAEQVVQRGGTGVNGAGRVTSCPCAFWSVPVHALSCACMSGCARAGMCGAPECRGACLAGSGG
jgi:hypothetical protein